jgi:hypothetical protein
MTHGEVVAETAAVQRRSMLMGEIKVAINGKQIFDWDGDAEAIKNILEQFPCAMREQGVSAMGTERTMTMTRDEIDQIYDLADLKADLVWGEMDRFLKALHARGRASTAEQRRRDDEQYIEIMERCSREALAALERARQRTKSEVSVPDGMDGKLN